VRVANTVATPPHQPGSLADTRALRTAARYTLERDLGYEARMVAECSHFWHAYVQANVPPPFDDGAGTQAYLKLAHGEVKEERK
jgi:hypothetical protein